MILFTILALLLIAFIVVGIIFAGTGCLAFFLVYGDVIICVALIVLIIRWLVKRRKK